MVGLRMRDLRGEGETGHEQKEARGTKGREEENLNRRQQR